MTDGYEIDARGFRVHPDKTCPKGDEKPAKKTRKPAAKKTSAPVVKEMKRSEEHTSELQSLMRISYAVFCLKKKKKTKKKNSKQVKSMNQKTSMQPNQNQPN